MSPPVYACEAEYATLLAAVHTAPADEVVRAVLADWVQDHDDEAEAAAIRRRRSFWVDFVPDVARCSETLFARINRLEVAAKDAPVVTAELARVMTELRGALEKLLAPVRTPLAVGKGE